ncbi:hypothetical protein IW150_000418 [Coemansia sp. RSA 2607]|nr:hypothetical protein IW150_000418 [Coemansia sp. RSA 2607]
MSVHFDQLVAEIVALNQGDDAADSNLEQLATGIVTTKLSEISTTEDTTQQQQQLLENIVDASLNEQVAATVSLAIIKAVINLMDANEAQGLDGAGRTHVLRHVLGRIHQRPTAFESVIVGGRLALANVLASQGSWTAAAQELRELRSEQLQRCMPSADQRLAVHVRTMEYFVRGGNLEQASLAMGRAAGVLPTVRDAAHIVWYRRVQASIHERTHKYIEAATAYRGIAQSCEHVDEQREMLDRAIRCVVLAAAGPQKMRVMAGLHREKLARSLASFGLLENMVLKRLIRPDELDAFGAQARLSPETLETLVRAVREHNVFVLSSLYSSMRFAQLGRSLGIDAEEAEATCAAMIGEGRMKGRIDQVAGVVTFEGSHEVEEVRAAISMKRHAAQMQQQPPMHFRETVAGKWDLRIVNLCQAVEDAVDLLIDRQPSYAHTLFQSMGHGA